MIVIIIIIISIIWLLTTNDSRRKQYVNFDDYVNDEIYIYIFPFTFYKKI